MPYKNRERRMKYSKKYYQEHREVLAEKRWDTRYTIGLFIGHCGLMVAYVDHDRCPKCGTLLDEIVGRLTEGVPHV